MRWLRPPLPRRSTLLLSFPRGLDPQVVQDLLAAFGQRRLPVPVSFELSARRERIDHAVVVPVEHVETIAQLLGGLLPGLRIERRPTSGVPPTEMSGDGATATVFRSVHASPTTVLDPDAAVAVSQQILHTLTGLRQSEAVWWQVTVRPAGAARPLPSPPRRSQQPTDALHGLFGSSQDPLTAHRAQEAKRSLPGLWFEARLQVRAPRAGRAAAVAEQLANGLRASNTSHGRVRIRRRGRRLGRAMQERRLRPWTASLANAGELAGLLSWPLALDALPGLTLGAAPLLPAPAGRSTTGAAVAVTPDGESLRIADQARVRHLHVVGPTGTGKSTLLGRLVLQDLTAGHPVVVLDPKVDLVSELLARWPSSRIDDLVLLDPVRDPVVGFNPLAGSATAETRAEHVLSTFRSLFRDSWGPRTDDILRASLLSLVATETPDRPASLADLPILLGDQKFRRRLLADLDDPTLQGFWGWYEALSDAERLQVTGPVSNKLRAVLARPRLRAVFGQRRGLHLADVLEHKQALLVPLDAGQLGADAARLMGSLVLLGLWQAIQTRSRIAPARRHPVMIAIDEYQELLHLPVPLDALLAQARGHGVGLTLSHQHLGQLPVDIREATLANAHSRVVFRSHRSDAKRLAGELGPLVHPDHLSGLGPREVLVQLATHDTVLDPATGRTQDWPATTTEPDKIAARALARHGQPRTKVEAELRADHTTHRDADEASPQVGGRPLP